MLEGNCFFPVTKSILVLYTVSVDSSFDSLFVFQYFKGTCFLIVILLIIF